MPRAIRRFLNRLFFRFVWPVLPIEWKWGYEIGCGHWQCFFAFNLSNAVKKAKKLSGQKEPFVARHDYMI